ncbi:Adenylate cyclase type 10 [Polyrhizophydium stewartii]|uniref:Adenylate cyclase type 10 n=1 Tax=Polyrhizophydium stewartii TaxID=2732419 RepID=A0ABR4N5P1_9FUNG
MDSYVARHIRDVYTFSDRLSKWPAVVTVAGIVAVVEFTGLTGITTALIEAGGPQGVERLRNVIGPFYTGIFTLATKWSGDITQFSITQGDVVTICWRSDSSALETSWAPAMISAEFHSIGCVIELIKFVNKYNSTLVGSDIGSKRVQVRVAIETGQLHHTHFGIKGARREHCVVGPAVASAHTYRKAAHEGEIVFNALIWTGLQQTINVPTIRPRPFRVSEQVEPDERYMSFLGTSKQALDTLDMMKRIMRGKRRQTPGGNGESDDPEMPSQQVLDVCREYTNSSAQHQIAAGTYLSYLRIMSTIVIKFRNVGIENPEHTANLFQHIMQHVVPVATKYEGWFSSDYIRTQNDEKNAYVTLTWGLDPNIHEKEAPFAARAAVALRGHIAKDETIQELAIGLATNLNFTGFIGNQLGFGRDDMRNYHLVFGLASNEALGIASMSLPNSVVVADKRTYEQASTFVRFKQFRRRRISHTTSVVYEPGEEPDLWEAVRPLRHVTMHKRVSNMPELIGREAEQMMIQQMFTRWRNGETNNLLVITGESGLGKTILGEFMINEALMSTSCIACFGRSNEIGRRKPYYSFQELFLSLARQLLQISKSRPGLTDRITVQHPRAKRPSFFKSSHRRSLSSAVGQGTPRDTLNFLLEDRRDSMQSGGILSNSGGSTGINVSGMLRDRTSSSHSSSSANTPAQISMSHIYGAGSFVTHTGGALPSLSTAGNISILAATSFNNGTNGTGVSVTANSSINGGAGGWMLANVGSVAKAASTAGGNQGSFSNGVTSFTPGPGSYSTGAASLNSGVGSFANTSGSFNNAMTPFSAGASLFKPSVSFVRRMSGSRMSAFSNSSSLNFASSTDSLLLQTSSSEMSTSNGRTSAMGTAYMDDRATSRIRAELVELLNIVGESQDCLALLNAFLPFKFKASAAQSVRSDSRHMALCQFMTRVLNKITMDMKIPVVLCFDDVQWLDSKGWELTNDLIHNCPKLCIVLLSRPLEEYENDAVASQISDLCKRDTVKFIKLPPLSRDMVRRLILTPLASEKICTIDEKLVQAIHTHSHGNCFVVQLLASKIVEIVHDLVNNSKQKRQGVDADPLDAGARISGGARSGAAASGNDGGKSNAVIVPEDDQEPVLHLFLTDSLHVGWTGADDIANLVGSGLRTVISSQIDQLSETYQLLLFVSAVLGQQIDLELLSDVVPRCIEIIGAGSELPWNKGDIGGMRAYIQAEDKFRYLVRKSTYENEPLRFRHVIIQEAIYSMISAEQREAIHAAIAERLEQLLTMETRGDILPALVHHLSHSRELVEKYALRLEQLFNYYVETGIVSEGVRTYELLNELEDSLGIGHKSFDAGQASHEAVLQYAHRELSIGKLLLIDENRNGQEHLLHALSLLKITIPKPGTVKFAWSLFAERMHLLFSITFGNRASRHSSAVDGTEIEDRRKIVEALERLATDAYRKADYDLCWLVQLIALNQTFKIKNAAPHLWGAQLFSASVTMMSLDRVRTALWLHRKAVVVDRLAESQEAMMSASGMLIQPEAGLDRALAPDKEMYLNHMAQSSLAQSDFAAADAGLSSVLRSLELKSVQGTLLGLQAFVVRIEINDFMGNIAEVMRLSIALMDVTSVLDPHSSWMLYGVSMRCVAKAYRLELDADYLALARRAIYLRSLFKDGETVHPIIRFRLWLNLIRGHAVVILRNLPDPKMNNLPALEKLVSKTAMLLEDMTAVARSVLVTTTWAWMWDALMFVLELADRRQSASMMRNVMETLMVLERLLGQCRGRLNQLLRSAIRAQLHNLRGNQLECVGGLTALLRDTHELSQGVWPHMRFRVQVALVMAVKRHQRVTRRRQAFVTAPSDLGTSISTAGTGGGTTGTIESPRGRRRPSGKVAPLDSSSEVYHEAKRYIHASGFKVYELLLDRGSPIAMGGAAATAMVSDFVSDDGAAPK